jgi:hypothetical protein
MSTDAFYRNKYKQSDRDKMDASDFAGPSESFPIVDQDDVDNAARLIGHAANPDAVKAKIIAIAKRKGLSIPKAWQEEGGSSGSEERMADTPVEAEGQPTRFSFYAPFVRIDGEQKDKREVVGKATRGTPIDTYGTVITYDASKRAFSRAKRIPVREMHQAKAVGKGLEWWGEDKDEDIFLHSYISRGAEDTWTKVQEDILVGYSIKGANAKYGTIERNGKTVPAITDYDLVEVSLVDNPSCPGCDIAIMRADGLDIEQEVIASDEELAEVFERIQAEETTPAQEETPVETQPAEIERKSVAISAANREKLHSTRDSITQMCAEAGCPDCQGMLANDADDGGGNTDQHIEERVAGIVEHAMAPVYQRMNAFLGQFSRAQNDTTAIQTSITTLSAAIERVAGTVATLLPASSLDEVRSELTDVKGQIERIAKTPLPGGPHTGRQAVGKHLATDGSASPSEAASTPEIMKQLHGAGVELNPTQSAHLIAASLKRM